MRSSDFDAPTPVKLDTSKLDGRLFEAHSSSKTKNGKDFSMNDLSKLMMVYKRGVELQSRSGDFSAEKARVASDPHQLRRRTATPLPQGCVAADPAYHRAGCACPPPPQVDLLFERVAAACCYYLKLKWCATSFAEGV